VADRSLVKRCGIQNRGKWLRSTTCGTRIRAEGNKENVERKTIRTPGNIYVLCPTWGHVFIRGYFIVLMVEAVSNSETSAYFYETIQRSIPEGYQLCLTQVDRWRHSVSDVVEYVTTENVTRIYFQHTSCIHTPVGNSNTLGLHWLITSYFEAFFLKERMNISDNLHKLRISHRMSFSHYKHNTCVSPI
jgi:hypothetical protein